MKQRLDLWLVALGHFPTRERARRAVVGGSVWLDTRRLDKASLQLDDAEAARLVIKHRDPAVSRAYYKLHHALAVFPVAVSGKTCLDVGASTGGFTQCLLEAGAALVYAVDCGTNQLDWKVRSDPRVISMEKTNARFLEPGLFSPLPELAVMDVSFISVSLLFPVLAGRLSVPELVVLVKPQFEAGRGEVGKGGVVRDPQVWQGCLARVIAAAGHDGYTLQGLDVSPLKGGEGNVEFLAWFVRAPGPAPLAPEEAVAAAIRKATDPEKETLS